VANLSKTLHINFYQNRSSIGEVMAKKSGVFYAPQCKWCIESPFKVAFFRTFIAYIVPASQPLIFLTRNTCSAMQQETHHTGTRAALGERKPRPPAVPIFSHCIHHVQHYIRRRFDLSGNGKESFNPILDPDADPDHHRNVITSKLDKV